MGGSLTKQLTSLWPWWLQGPPFIRLSIKFSPPLLSTPHSFFPSSPTNLFFFSSFLTSFSFVYDPLCLIRIVFLSIGGRLFVWSKKTYQWLPLRNISHASPHLTIHCLKFFRADSYGTFPNPWWNVDGLNLFSVPECVACKYICVPHLCKVPTQVKSHWIPWKCSYGWLWATMWVLGTNTGALQE